MRCCYICQMVKLVMFNCSASSLIVSDLSSSTALFKALLSNSVFKPHTSSFKEQFLDLLKPENHCCHNFYWFFLCHSLLIFLQAFFDIKTKPQDVPDAFVIIDTHNEPKIMINKPKHKDDNLKIKEKFCFVLIKKGQ